MKVIALTALLLLLTGTPAMAQAQATGPTPAALCIEKIDPPNWWLGLPDPMLLIQGEGLTNAKVASTYPGVTVKRTENSLGGKYLFLWLQIGAAAHPGKVTLRITSSGGTADVTLPLAVRSPAAKTAQQDGGFNGLAPGDVVLRIRSTAGARSANAAPALRELERKLPDWKQLGVTALELPPLYPQDSASPGHYDAPVDFYSVDDRLGTLQDYKELVQAAHGEGVKVVLDLVMNNVGPQHVWMASPPNGRWFHGTPQKHLVAHSELGPLTDPHAPPHLWRDQEEGWMGATLPDLNTGDRWVGQYLRQNAMWWAETGKLDGVRLGSFPYVDRQFWHDLEQALHKEYPRLLSTGEVSSHDPTITSFFVGKKTVEGIDTGVDTLYDVPLSAAIRAVIMNGAPASRLMEVLRHDWMYPDPESLVTFVPNEDATGAAGAADHGVGHEAMERLALSLLLTMRGIPIVDENGSAQPELSSHLQKLLQLRRQNVALRQGKQYHIDAGDDFYAFARIYLGAPGGLQGIKTQRLLVILNNADTQRHFSVPVADTPLETAETATAILGSASAKVANGHIDLDVAARSVVIYEVQCGCDL